MVRLVGCPKLRGLKQSVLVLTGYGINCDDETKFAFEKAGARAEIVHINDLIDSRRKLGNYDIFALPGGFTYGDDTGAGIACANKIKANLNDDLQRFIESQRLVIGICNGFQVLVNTGVFGKVYGDRQVALVSNDRPRYDCRWVDLQFFGNSPWLKGIDRMSIPIAHGEGKFYAEPATLRRLNEKGMIAARYVTGNICHDQRLPPNPNGSLENIAAITNEAGNVLGAMPHPERNIDFTHSPDWTDRAYELRLQGKSFDDFPEDGPGIQIFRNAVQYCR